MTKREVPSPTTSTCGNVNEKWFLNFFDIILLLWIRTPHAMYMCPHASLTSIPKNVHITNFR
jgi:hypothetical protein